jgi:alpha-L-fucosidase 2
LYNQLQYVDAKSKSPVDNYGLYPNLFNSDGPDLIMNGNGCATAVITEMLLQSHNGEITLLPALPEVFQDGEVRGLRARGGFEVDIKWTNHQLASATIVSKIGNDCIIRTKQPVRIFAAKKEISASKVGDNVYRFKTQKDEKYLITIQ